MTGPLTRILLRYGAGALIAQGFVSPEIGEMLVSDPDLAAVLQIGVGALIGMATELYYRMARKWGWAT